MKRTIVIAAGLAALGLGVFLAGPGRAQQGGSPAVAPLRTRIALINMVQVLKNYNKFKADEEQLKTQIKAADAKLAPYKDAMMKLQNDAQKATEPAERERLEKEFRRQQQQAKDAAEDANRDLTKLQGTMAVKIYREVEDAVKMFAQYNDIELVLMYNDADKNVATDFYNPTNISRKMMMAGPLMPLYYDNRMDITPHVTKMLNDQLNRGQ